MVSIPQDEFCPRYGCPSSIDEVLSQRLCVSGGEDVRAPVKVYQGCGVTIVEDFVTPAGQIDVFNSMGTLVASQSASDTIMSTRDDCDFSGWSFGDVPRCDAWTVTQSCYDRRFLPDAFADGSVTDAGASDAPVDS